MSIRLKLILSYSISVIVSVFIIIIVSAIVVTGFFSTVYNSIFNSDFDVVMGEMMDLVVDIRMSEKYMPENLTDPVFLTKINSGITTYDGGIIVKSGDIYYDYTELNLSEDFYTELEVNDYSQMFDNDNFSEDEQKHSIDYHGNEYIYFDYKICIISVNGSKKI